MTTEAGKEGVPEESVGARDDTECEGGTGTVPGIPGDNQVRRGRPGIIHNPYVGLKRKNDNNNTEQQGTKKVSSVSEGVVVVSPARGVRNTSDESDDEEESGVRGNHSSTAPIFEPILNFEELDDPVSFLNTPPEIMCRNLGGGIDLIWINQGSNEAYLQPFTSVYFKQGSPRNKTMKKATKIFAMVSRRVSKERNTIQYKPTKDGTAYFKKSYFVRFRGHEPEEEWKLKNSLLSLAQVRK